MRRWLTFCAAALVTGAISSACNSIAGLDDVSGAECKKPSDCPGAGECTEVSCTESGRCAYEIAAEAPCTAHTGLGVCTDRGVCVECLEDAHCEKSPAGRKCDEQRQRCVPLECTEDAECNTSAGEACHDGECVQCWLDAPARDCGPGLICSTVDGRCVECDTGANCNNQKLPGPECWQFLCVDRACVPTPDEGAPCQSVENGICKANAVCSPVP